MACTSWLVKMPVFGFETHENRKKLTSTMRNPLYAREDETSRLIHGYFNNDKFPLHCRRTLDQFTYHMLSNTESRDRSQVMFRWTKRQQLEKHGLDHQPNIRSSPASICRDRDKVRNSCPLLMIDQLWLWVLEHEGEDTVITSLPNTWEST
jgi:hypothetical protein